MADFPEAAFTFFSYLNRSKPEDKSDYWAKSEWPIEEIIKLYEWATDPGTKTMRDKRGQECVVITQNFYPKTSTESGNAYYLGVTKANKNETKTLGEVTKGAIPF